MCLLTCVPSGTQKRPIGALSQRSLANTRRADTPHILPVRGSLEDVKRLMRGDFYIGRGSRQRSLKRSTYANDFKVSEFGRETAISKFGEKMATDVILQSTLWTLSGARLLCHCSARQACHADVIIEACRRQLSTNRGSRSSSNSSRRPGPVHRGGILNSELFHRQHNTPCQLPRRRQKRRARAKEWEKPVERIHLQVLRRARRPLASGFSAS